MNIFIRNPKFYNDLDKFTDTGKEWIKKGKLNLFYPDDDSEFYIIDGLLIQYLGYDEKVIIPDNVIGITADAFQGKWELKHIEIPETVRYICPNLFFENKKLQRIIVHPDNPYYDSRNNCNGIIETATNTLIARCSKTRIPTQVKTLHQRTYGINCGILERYNGKAIKPKIPSSIYKISSYAFDFAKQLKIIHIPDNITEISNTAFENCCNIEKISVSNTNKVYDSRNNCNAIIETKTNTLLLGCKNTIIPKTIKRIGEYAFSNTKGLNKIAIPEKVEIIDKCAFSDCKELKEITIPASVKQINCGAFAGCTNMEKVVILNTATKIHTYAFNRCKKLTIYCRPNSEAELYVKENTQTQYNSPIKIEYI